jgi:hypothetical protein
VNPELAGSEGAGDSTWLAIPQSHPPYTATQTNNLCVWNVIDV